MVNQQNAVVRWGMIVIVILAGVWTLVHLVLGLSGSTANDGWGIALLILFIVALILAFVEYAQERPTLVSTGSSKRFPEPAISKFFLASEGSAGMWFVVRMYVGAEWLLAGWEKVISPVWGGSGKALAGFVAGALAKASLIRRSRDGMPRFYRKLRFPMLASSRSW